MLNLWLFHNKISISLFVFLLIVKISSAVEFGISPPELIFEANAQEETCENLTFFSSYENLSLILSDKWAPKGKQTKNPLDYISNSSDLKISISYPKAITAQKENLIPICISAERKGIFRGMLILEAEQSLMLAAWIHFNATSDNISLENLFSPLTGFVSKDSFQVSNHKWLILESFFLLLVLVCLALILMKRRKEAFSLTN
ncbi:MAG: hypothetical protein AABX07_05375 [Nanoarchaeota archaeon]